MTKKHGLPKALEAERLDDEHPEEHLTPEEFVKDFFGSNDKPQDDKGLPSLSWLKDQFKTKSAAIRFLVNQGFEVKDIAKHLGVRYQHVRNVATSPLKRGPNEDWRKPLLPQIELPKKDEDSDDEG